MLCFYYLWIFLWVEWRWYFESESFLLLLLSTPSRRWNNFFATFNLYEYSPTSPFSCVSTAAMPKFDASGKRLNGWILCACFNWVFSLIFLCYFIQGNIVSGSHCKGFLLFNFSDMLFSSSLRLGTKLRYQFKMPSIFCKSVWFRCFLYRKYALKIP